jgi:hypothetical protein
VANKELTLVIRAKNLVAQGLTAAGSAISSFASTAGRALGTVAKWAGILGGAFGGFSVVKAVSAFMSAEKASNDLRQALELNGFAISEYQNKLEKASTSLMTLTGVEDDAIQTSMAAMLMYGLQADKLEEAAKGVIALTRAGMGQEQAEKAIVAAVNGNFTALTKFIPALRTANNEAEKAAIVNQFLASQFSASKGDLATTAGAWKNLKTWIGEAMESIGEAIVKVVDLPALFARIAAGARSVALAISDWVQGEKFAAIRDGITGIMAAIEQGGTTRTEMFSALGDVIVSAFEYGASIIGDAIRNAFKDTLIGRIGGAASYVNNVRGELLTRAGVIAGGGTLADANAQVRKERAETAAYTGKSEAKAKYDASLAKVAQLGAQAKAAQDASAAGQFERAQAEARKIVEENAKRKGMNLAEGPEFGPGNMTPEEIKKMREDVAKAEEERVKKIGELSAQMYEKEKQRQQDELDAVDELRDAKIAALRDELAEKQRIAKISISDYIAERKAAKDGKKQAEEEDKKAARLTRLEKRKQGQMGGGKLNESDAEWLAGYRQQRGAAKGIGNATADIAKAEQAKLLAAQVKRDKVAADHLTETQKIGKALAKLLAMG